MSPDVREVLWRLGPGYRLTEAPHWIGGRRGRTYYATHGASGRRSVFKWCSRAEMVCWRDLLPGAPVATPAVLRAWEPEDAGTEEARSASARDGEQRPDASVAAAVELEWIPQMATDGPCYRFSPVHLPMADPAWRGPRLDALVASLGRMHARYAGGAGLAAHEGLLTRWRPEADLENWRGDLRKLEAVAHLPGGSRWLDFWAPRAEEFRQILDELTAHPVTWLWGDAKWDHVGCREDGSVAVLEWSTTLGPAGSDLYLLLHEPPERREQLLAVYASAAAAGAPNREGSAAQSLGGTAVAGWQIWLGLLRACFVHGPGQACLSLRGVADGASSDEDKAAWHADAETTARWVAAGAS
jgi:hypothetical protein